MQHAQLCTATVRSSFQPSDHGGDRRSSLPGHSRVSPMHSSAERGRGQVSVEAREHAYDEGVQQERVKGKSGA